MISHLIQIVIPAPRISLLLFASGSACFAQLEFGEQIKIADPISRIDFSEIVDMDGDGDIDVVSATVYGLQINWWENDGSGNFTRHKWRPENAINEGIFGVGDWNNDGRQDVWLLEKVDINETFGGNVRQLYKVAIGTTDGSFADPVTVIDITGRSFSSESIILSDLNGDDVLDILNVEGVFLGNPDGTFRDQVAIEEGIASLDWSVRYEMKLYDFDRDGDLDFFPSIRRPKLQVFENIGEGAFAPAKDLLESSPDFGLDDFAFMDPEQTEGQPILIVLSESDDEVDSLNSYSVDGDGTLIKTGSLTLPKTDSDLSLNWVATYRDEASGRIFVECYVRGDDVLKIRLGEVTSSPTGLAVEILHEVEGIGLLHDTSIQKIDGDDVPDVIVPVGTAFGTTGSVPDHIVWQSGNQQGSFSAERNFIAEPTFAENFEYVGDMDDDGDIDLLFLNSYPVEKLNETGRLTILRNSGDGLNFTEQTIPADRGLESILAFDDFEMKIPEIEDSGNLPERVFPIGKLDLILISRHYNYQTGSRHDEISVAFQDSDGKFLIEPVRTIDGAHSFIYKDWDGDGENDILYVSYPGDLYWMKRNGVKNGVNFDDPQKIVSLPLIIAVLDMDDDGDLDLYAYGNFNGEDTDYWVERGEDGSLGASHNSPTPLQFKEIDTDGDSRIDTTTVNFGDGNYRTGTNASALYNNSDSRLGPLELYVDLDGDGDPDRVSSGPTFGVSGFQRLFWSENMGTTANPELGESVLFNGLEFATRDHFVFRDFDNDGAKDLMVISTGIGTIEFFKVTNRPGPQPFENWMGAQNLTGSSAGPRADWDQDGSSNWAEFIYGTQVKVPESGELNLPRIEKDSGGINFTYTRRKSSAELNLFYPMERSMKLDGDWEPWNLGAVPTTALGDYEQVRIPITPTEKAEFFRVRPFAKNNCRYSE